MEPQRLQVRPGLTPEWLGRCVSRLSASTVSAKINNLKFYGQLGKVHVWLSHHAPTQLSESHSKKLTLSGNLETGRPGTGRQARIYLYHTVTDTDTAHCSLNTENRTIYTFCLRRNLLIKRKFAKFSEVMYSISSFC